MKLSRREAQMQFFDLADTAILVAVMTFAMMVVSLSAYRLTH